MMPFSQWLLFEPPLVLQLLQGGESWCITASAVLFCDAQLVGGPEEALDWVIDTFSISFDREQLEDTTDIYQETQISRKVIFLEIIYRYRWLVVALIATVCQVRFGDVSLRF